MKPNATWHQVTTSWKILSQWWMFPWGVVPGYTCIVWHHLIPQIPGLDGPSDEIFITFVLILPWPLLQIIVTELLNDKLSPILLFMNGEILWYIFLYNKPSMNKTDIR